MASLNRHCQLQRSRLDTTRNSEMKSSSVRKQEDTLHPSWVKFRRLERTEMILWMLADSDNGRDDLLSRERGKNPLAKGKEQDNMVQSHQHKQTRRRSKAGAGIASIEGLLGKDTAATESRTIEFSWRRKRCERQVRQRWRKERQLQRCWSTCLESANWTFSCELGGVVRTADGNTHSGWDD